MSNLRGYKAIKKGSFKIVALHKATLNQQRLAMACQEQGLLPHQVQLILDFIENMKISVTRDEIQSAHWATEAASIFAAVVRVVDIDIWNDVDGCLKSKDEVLCRQETGNYEAGIVSETYEPTSLSKLVKVTFMRKSRGHLYDQRDCLVPETSDVPRGISA